jgi:hypothetical protein
MASATDHDPRACWFAGGSTNREGFLCKKAHHGLLGQAARWRRGEPDQMPTLIWERVAEYAQPTKPASTAALHK